MTRPAWMQISVFCGAIAWVACSGHGALAVGDADLPATAMIVEQPAVEPATKLADPLLIVDDEESLDAHISHSLSAPALPAEMLTQPDESLERALPVPEPTSVALLGGLGALLILVHRLRIYFDRSASR